MTSKETAEKTGEDSYLESNLFRMSLLSNLFFRIRIAFAIMCMVLSASCLFQPLLYLSRLFLSPIVPTTRCPSSIYPSSFDTVNPFVWNKIAASSRQPLANRDLYVLLKAHIFSRKKTKRIFIAYTSTRPRQRRPQCSWSFITCP